MAQGMQVATDEIDVLAEYLGNIDPEALLANWDQVGPMMAAVLAEGEAAFDRLNEAAFICITGTSVADFSALTNGLVSVKNLAAETVQALIATGQWTTETITLPQEGAQWDPISGTWTRTTLNTNQTVLKYTGSNPLRSGGGSSGSGRSGGGGKGGGGGSSSTEVSKSIQKMLDQMDEDQGFEDHYRKMAQLAQGYHEARGEIQGVILYLEKERALVADNTETLRGYVRTLETQIEQKQAELAKYKEGSKKYKQAAVDLEALQSAHQQYSEQLLENMTDLEELQDQIEEWHNTVREMEIDLRELIHDAILDREALNQRMLEGRIDLENELMDVLTRRYEKERDELIEVAELKREALNEELSALDEQLEARKKLNEQQDRAKLLAEKEAQLARISADPTRKKEELALREEIAELREEMAWELAEEEVNAQKKSIEAQIDSIDEYIEYVENYYEELLSNPRKLIEELQELMTRSDEEILAWLEANHEEYETATDATRESMRLGWQEMLDDMRGYTQTYWDEVEEIIAQGDDAIIEFLKQNSADYKEAGRLQAEAYVDEWKKKLQELKDAMKSVSDSLSSVKYTSTSSKTSGSSGSSSKSGGSSGSVAKVTLYQATYPAIGSAKGGTLKGYIRSGYLVRLERDGAYDWFLLNAPKRSHKGLAVSATITCQHICAQLSKKNLYLSFDDGNGVGTAQFLLEQILRNTGWRLDFCETFYEQDGETEKVRSIKSEGKRGAYLLISDVCKLFGARPVFDGDSRSVRVCSLNRYEDLLELSFGKNLTAIDRKEDAENIVTRLYVEGEYSDSGYVGIDEVNPTGLPFLLDFSYFRELGVFTDAHQAALDAYLRDVRTAKADSSETAAQLIEMDGQLNSLWGQTDYVLYVLEGGAAKRIIPGGGATDAQKEIGDEDVVTVLLSDGTHREQNGPTFEADAQYAVKWIQRASGVIGGREVAIEAKRSSIQSLYRQYEKETDETKRQSLLDQIAALEDEIAQLYVGTDADEGLYALMRRAVLLAIDRDDLRQVYEDSLSGQEAIEYRFAQAMGDMLIDGYWSNTSYLSFQMPQNQQAFSLVGRTDIYPCNNSMLAIYCGFHQIAHATFRSVVDIAAIRIACTGGASFCGLL